MKTYDEPQYRIDLLGELDALPFEYQGDYGTAFQDLTSHYRGESIMSENGGYLGPCYECRFFFRWSKKAVLTRDKEAGRADGECRRNSPVAVSGEDRHITKETRRWPQVLEKDGCGDFQPRGL